MYRISGCKAKEQYLSFTYRHCRFTSPVCLTKIADTLHLFVLNLQHKRENAGDECVIFRQFTFNLLMNSDDLETDFLRPAAEPVPYTE